MKEIKIESLHSQNDKLELFLFNVGQGDHIMLKFPTLEYGIIDFYYETASNIIEPPCLTYFKELKRILPANEFVKITISFFCISHTDKDHVKGISETIRWFHDNEILIKEIWLGAAKDEAQLYDFLRVRLASAIDGLSVYEQLKYSNKIKTYNNGMDEFFKYFEKWKKKEFKSVRYLNEESGIGEYLVDIRSLRRPCALEKCEAINLGPLGSQIDNYTNNLTLDLVRKLLGIRQRNKSIDKNLISHILKIKFGATNLLFGGDTGKNIWEECLDRYENNEFTFLRDFGKIESHFIKVSHHGSINSSSSKIWDKTMASDSQVSLGISAGKHKGYKHPNFTTIDHIKNIRKNVSIHSTNICKNRIHDSHIAKELHLWYDIGVRMNQNYGKEKSNIYDEEINETISKTSYSDKKGIQNKSYGLFAYIFQISDNPKERIKVRMALSNTNKTNNCFHEKKCDKILKSCRKEHN
jgi:beta-lactamase superfamily II metal-dependent hydrolase